MYNSEQLIAASSIAISEHLCLQDTACRLGLLEGKVVALSLKDNRPHFKQARTITKWQCHHGFTSAEWNTIGTELFNLQMENQKCHQPQEHSQKNSQKNY